MQKATRTYLCGLLLIGLALVIFHSWEKRQSEEVTILESSRLTAHFLDVGQADCIVMTAPGGQTMMIDAGNNGDAEQIMAYLHSLRIEKIDILIGTHPHEDHIGAMDRVINELEIGQIILPKVAANTQTFRDLLTAIKKKGLKVTTAQAGMTLELEPRVQIQLYAPLRESYEELNNYSVVARMSYDEVAFLLTGDAEVEVEEEILNQGRGIRANVLKVGHHGSYSSTSEKFLNAVAPEYAVISVGSGNRYGHPDEEVLTRLTGSCRVFRTDQQGNIVIETDGKEIIVRSDR